MLPGASQFSPIASEFADVDGDGYIDLVADGYDDCEGDLLQRVREIIGPDVVLGAELDPHSHLTPEMVVEARRVLGAAGVPCGAEMDTKELSDDPTMRAREIFCDPTGFYRIYRYDC